ncbi:MAG: LamG-like jellyroll fold domain-containing protein [Planctomycetota bacterium]
MNHPPHLLPLPPATPAPRSGPAANRLRSAPTLRRRPLPSRRGLTLVELIVVLAIVVILATIAIGVFVRIASSNQDVARQEDMKDLLTDARASAIYGQGSAKVVVDTAQGTVTEYGIVPLGMWSMEEIEGGIVKGAGGFDGSAVGVTPCPGKYGQAAYFNSGIGGGSAILLPPGPFEIDEGIRLEAWVYCEGDSDSAAFTATQTIIDKEGAYRLQIDPGGVVEAGTPGKAVVSTARLAANAWFKVTAQMDRHEYVVFINDALVARVQIRPQDLASGGSGAGHGPLGDCAYGQPLKIGAGEGQFHGAIDEVRIWSVEQKHQFKLDTGHGEERLESNLAPLNAIYFAPDGTLDSRFHLSPARISYEREGYEYDFVVGRLGAVQMLDPVSVNDDSGPDSSGSGSGGGSNGSGKPAQPVQPAQPTQPVQPVHPNPPGSGHPPPKGGATGASAGPSSSSPKSGKGTP